MPEELLTVEVAVSKIRQLSNTENFPFHPEGESRLARVLIENCAGATHAQFVIDEFDEAEKCPTVEALRAAARRLAELCECGKAKWQHRDGTACARFAGRSEDDEWQKTPTGFAKFRQSVPLVPSVPWEVCLQVEATRIHLGFRGSPPDSGQVALCEKRFPELCATIRAGRDPDYALVESQMRALFPRMWKGGGKSVAPREWSSSGRLKQVTTGFARAE